MAFAVIERHGHNIGVKHLHVFVPQFSVFAFFLQFVSDVLGGIDDVLGFAILDFGDGITIVVPPLRVFVGATVEQDLDVKLLLLPTDESCIALMQIFALLGGHAPDELLWRHSLCG